MKHNVIKNVSSYDLFFPLDSEILSVEPEPEHSKTADDTEHSAQEDPPQEEEQNSSPPSSPTAAAATADASAATSTTIAVAERRGNYKEQFEDLKGVVTSSVAEFVENTTMSDVVEILEEENVLDRLKSAILDHL